jgi:hypothetical protein
MAKSDFFYRREGQKGVCIFIDGSVHEKPGAAARDNQLRDALENRGFSVDSIDADADFLSQVMNHLDVFGKGQGIESAPVRVWRLTLRTLAGPLYQPVIQRSSAIKSMAPRTGGKPELL